MSASGKSRRSHQKLRAPSVQSAPSGFFAPLRMTFSNYNNCECNLTPPKQPEVALCMRHIAQNLGLERVRRREALLGADALEK